MKTRFSAALVAALLTLPGMSWAQTRITVVQAHANVAVGEEVFLYAVPKAMGWFRDEGLDVSLQGAGGGVQAGQVMQSGAAQIATMLAENVLQVREAGGTSVAFYSLKRNNGYAVAVLDSSPIRNLQDVKGKTIGFAALGSGAVLSVKQSMQDIGIAPSEWTAVATGTGGAAMIALQSKRVDGLGLWDAMYGSIENMGVKMRYIDLPVLDRIAGFSIATTSGYMASNPKVVEGYCRAVAKGLLFTRLNPQAAIKLFHKEFPTVVPGGMDAKTAVANDVNVLNRWLERAEQGIPVGQERGDFSQARWTETQAFFKQNGILAGTTKVEDAYTDRFLDACNNFDRAAVTAAAKTAD
jgi:NitT/TauT family transport system substrate-binding protein